MEIFIPGVKAERFDVVAVGMFVTPMRCAAVRFCEPTFGIQQSLVVPNSPLIKWLFPALTPR